MASRTISLEQSAYQRLAAAKRAGESFSDVVNRLTQQQEPSLLDLVGVIPAKAGDELKETVLHHRAEQAEIASRRKKRFWPEA